MNSAMQSADSSGLDVQHGVGMEAQVFEGLFLVELVLSPGEVAHDFEGRGGHSSHPEVDVLHAAFPR